MDTILPKAIEPICFFKKCISPELNMLSLHCLWLWVWSNGVTLELSFLSFLIHLPYNPSLWHSPNPAPGDPKGLQIQSLQHLLPYPQPSPAMKRSCSFSFPLLYLFPYPLFFLLFLFSTSILSQSKMHLSKTCSVPATAEKYPHMPLKQTHTQIHTQKSLIREERKKQMQYHKGIKSSKYD